MHRDTWRPQQENSLLRSKTLRIGLLIVVAGGLAAALLFILYAPFYQPVTHLVLLSGGESDSINTLPLGYASEDIARMKQAGDHLRLADPRSRTVTAAALRSTQALRSFAGQLRALPASRRDTVMVYAAAHGVSHGAEPYLLCGDYSGENSADSRFPLEEFLQQLRDTRGGIKILLLDAGRIQSDTTAGMVVNGFPHLLRKSVHETGDKSLWVISSHAAFERGGVSHHLKASLFGWFAQQGLHGKADANHDNVLTLRELHAYIATGVNQWTKESARGKMQQRPQLIWGGGEIKNHDNLEIAALPQPQPKPAASDPPGATPQTAAANGLGPQASHNVYASTPPLFLPAVLSQIANQPAASANDQQPEPVADKPQAGPALAAPVPDAVDPAALEAWRLRDTIETLNYRESRIVDFAPHYWRRLEERLTNLQQRLRSNPAALALLEKETAQTLQPLLAALQPHSGKAPDPGIQPPEILQTLPQINIQGSRLRSFALAQRVAARGGPQLMEGLADCAAELKKILTSGDADALQKWAAETYQPHYSQYAELALAAQVASISHLQWEDKQLLISCRLQSEAAFASTLGSADWTTQHFTTADSWRVAGEHLLLDGAGLDWRQQGVSYLRRAAHQYAMAAQELGVIEDARLQIAVVMHRLPYYLQWRELSATDSSSGAPSLDDLNTLLDLIPQMLRLLAEPSHGNIAAVQQCASSIQSIEHNLLQPVLHPEQLTEGRNIQLSRIESLLATPLPSAAALAQLQPAAMRLDKQLATSFSMTVKPVAPANTPTTAQWRQQYLRAAVELKFARLSAGEATTHSREFSTIENAWKKVQKLHEKLEETQDAEMLNGQLWQAFSQLGSAFEEFHRLLPARIREATRRNLDMTATATRQSRRHALREASLSVRLLDGNLHARTSALQRATALDGAAMYDHLLAARSRFLAEAVDVVREQRTALIDAASDYRRLANIQLRQPTAGVFTSPQVRLQTPASVTFAASPQKTIPLSLNVSGGSRTPGWIVLQYDPQVLEVTSSRPVYHEHLLQAAAAPPTPDKKTATAGQLAAYPYYPDKRGLPASLYVRPGAAAEATLTIRARQEQTASTKLIVKVLAAGVYTRREIMVHPPAPFNLELAVNGAPGTTTVLPTGVQVHPFPNQATSFNVRLKNNGETPKELEVQFLAAPSRLGKLPVNTLSPATADELLKPHGPFKPLSAATLKIAPGSELPLPLPAYKAAEPKEPEATTLKPAGLQIQGDMLVKIIEKKTGRVILRRIEIKPQAPVRYVQPVVSYDSRQRRIGIVVSPLTPGAAPERVTVQCEVVSGLPGAEGKIRQAMLIAPARQAELSIETPPGKNRQITLHLHVDGYPRAFIYRVNCNYSQPQIAPLRNVLAIRARQPAGQTAYKSPVESIPAVFEVDAPAGSFNNPNDVVELAVDIDEDRDFLREIPLRLTSDRQVQVAWGEAKPDGTLSLNTAVTDFHVSLPAPGIQHQRVNLLGRVQSAGKVAWSADRYVWIDGEGPQTGSPRISSTGFTAVGDPVVLSLLATDQGSGVAKIEVAIDTDFDGKLPVDPPPVAAKRNPDGLWTAELDTAKLAPGSYQILIHSVDKVGNAGKLMKTELVLLSPTDVEKARANSVAGVVLYGAGDHVRGAKVTLTPAEKGDPIGPVTGDDQGHFELPVVPPGKYTLHAEGLFRNRVRMADIEIEVPARPVEFPAMKVMVSSTLAPKPIKR